MSIWAERFAALSGTRANSAKSANRSDCGEADLLAAIGKVFLPKGRRFHSRRNPQKTWISRTAPDLLALLALLATAGMQRTKSGLRPSLSRRRQL